MASGRWVAGLVIASLLAGCSSDHDREPIERGRAALLGGRPSDESEDAAVYIETKTAEATLRCSGYVVAPGLVLTARHCVLKRKSENVACTADGTPKDVSDTTDLRSEPPELVTVYVGADKAAHRAIAVRQILTVTEVTICRSDVAFLVLAEPGLDVRMPLRRELVHLGEAMTISGWGYTSDDRGALPKRRSTLEGLVVTEVGPGRIPDGTFATSGNSLCFGDSGAVALIDGAVAGVYSRIEGDPPICALELTRNVLSGLGPHADLVKRAYAGIGEEPWYLGERPPWLAAPGAPCTKDDECRSAVCDRAHGTCIAPCGDAGLACPAGQLCEASTMTCRASEDGTSTAAPTPSSSCATSRSHRSLSNGALVASVGVAALLRRRRRS
jgi:hypothetical protein